MKLGSPVWSRLSVTNSFIAFVASVAVMLVGLGSLLGFPRMYLDDPAVIWTVAAGVFSAYAMPATALPVVALAITQWRETRSIARRERVTLAIAALSLCIVGGTMLLLLRSGHADASGKFYYDVTTRDP